MTGIIDPTPASDGTNAIISLSRGRWIDAVISVVSIVPYVGDFAKLGKLPRYLKSIKKAIRIARTDFHWSNALKRLFIPLKKVIDQLYELGANKLPPHANKTLSQIKREIDHFLKPASSGTTANQTVGEFIANSSKNSSPKAKQSGDTPSKSKQINIEEKPKKGVSSEKESGIIDGNGVKNTSNNADVPEHTYRGDSRNPDEIFDKGFEPRAKGSDTSLEDYTQHNKASDYVGTSKDPDVAKDFADGDGYVYTVKPENGVDVNKELGNRSPFPNEQEVVIPGGIKPESIKGATPTNKDGSLGNSTILNPNHYKKLDE